ncbi:hypothetical protein GCM10009038_15040 [Salinicola rhizosphaerae]|uniref:Uncharacterized protein n=1 Tax=Salinicola rhizosphaerae TaxID=1443141 RepID=A0ABQ3DXM1_9GAMM|nr:hypothetical protein GCM10009038_15040 [Salinicola rhizosphaerae]
MGRQRRDVEHLLGDILGSECLGTAIELVGRCLVAAGAHQRELGLGDAGREIGDTNAGAEQVTAQVVAELLDERFGRAIDVAARVRPLTGNRTHVDDRRAAANVDQRRQKRVSHVDKPRDVGVDHGVPVLDLDLLRRLGRQRQSRIVDQRAHALERLRQFIDRFLHGLVIAHIEHDDVHVDLVGEFRLQRVEAIATTPGEHQRPASLGKTMGGSAAESGSRTGDKSNVVHNTLLVGFRLD